MMPPELEEWLRLDMQARLEKPSRYYHLTGVSLTIYRACGGEEARVRGIRPSCAGLLNEKFLSELVKTRYQPPSKNRGNRAAS
jgi:hypothetical protein